jgi:plasmid stabilization system protein ParE
MVIEWSARARADIRDLRAYIAKDSPHYARRFIEKIFRAAETLTANPQIGRKVPEADRNDIRELVFRNYRIIYRPTAEKIYIVTVLHGSRNLEGQTVKPWEVA